MNKKDIITATLKNGASGAAVIEVGKIPFKREFRDACEQNTCGKFGRCWMCPPDVGNIDEMLAKAKTYRHTLVFNTISKLEDSFDIEGMEKAAKNHNAVTQTLAIELEDAFGDVLKLGAGACHVCEHCARIENIPCRHPKKALASMEAYGIAVSELAGLCGLSYIGGKNTLTYFGAFLFN